MKEENVQFIITPEQAKQICAFYDVNYNDLDEYEICELLNQIIDELDIK